MPLTEDQIAHAGRQLAARRGFTLAAAVNVVRTAEATWNEIAALVEPAPELEAAPAPAIAETIPEPAVEPPAEVSAPAPVVETPAPAPKPKATRKPKATPAPAPVA